MSFEPVIHPGMVLATQLKALGVTPTELARQIRVPANRITQIVQGKRSVTGDTAVRLGHWFSVSPRYWLSLQQKYELALAQRALGLSIHELPSYGELAAKALDYGG